MNDIPLGSSSSSELPPDDTQRADYERRIELLVKMLPQRFQNVIRWLRRPEQKWVRIPCGLLLLIGSVLSFLPVFGIWMLPVGMLLLSDDIALFRRLTDRMLAWVERRHPRWLGLSGTSESDEYSSGK